MKSNRQPCSRAGSGHRGFTLTEIMIVVVIIGILATLAAPSFNEIIRNQRIKSMATDLSSSLALARSEAVKRNSNMTVLPTGSWQNGWEVVVPNPPPSDQCSKTSVIEVHDAFKNLTATGPTCVTYRSSGRILGNTAPAFNISAAGTSSQRCVSVDLSGRPYMKDAAC